MMRRKLVSILAMTMLLLNGVPASASAADGTSGGKTASGRPVISDHTCADLGLIPSEWAQKAKEKLHIAYGHTSHGSQITYGMMGLRWFREEPFIYEKGAPKGSIDLRDNPFGGEMDLGNPDGNAWAEKTRKYLENNSGINVVIWSWCGQLSKADDAYVKNYLDRMQGLESQFPNVTFVYMTGHLDGTGPDGTLAKANNRIREFCRDNNKVLFDFADIESYDPDGNYYGDKCANAACWYDSDGDGKQDRNWAQDWQNRHVKDKDWYDCYAAHTEPLNANRKAYAMWWLLARIAGWNGSDSKDTSAAAESDNFEYYAEKLNLIGLFKGNENGYELKRTPTRLEGAAMLTRLLGGEKEALAGLYAHPFRDALKTWGNPYVGYLHKYSLTKGISDKQFGCNLKLEAASYMTFLLRVLGYSDKNGDFRWEMALEKARDLGIVDKEYYSALKQAPFDRGHLVKLTVLSLNAGLKGESMTLLEKLVKGNVIDKKAAERF